MSPDRTEMACSAVQAQLGAILKHKQVGALPTHTETNPTGTDDLSVKMKSEDYQRKARGHILKYPSEESQKVQPRAVKSQRKTRTETLRVTTERWSPAVGGRMGEGSEVRASSCSPRRPGRACGTATQPTVRVARLQGAWTVRQRGTERPSPATAPERVSLKRKTCGVRRRRGRATRGLRPPCPRRTREHTAGTPPTLPPLPPMAAPRPWVPRRGCGLALPAWGEGGAACLWAH